MKINYQVSRILQPAERRILILLMSRSTPATEAEITAATGIKGVRQVILRLRGMLHRHSAFIHSDYGEGYFMTPQSKARLLK